MKNALGWGTVILFCVYGFVYYRFPIDTVQLSNIYLIEYLIVALVALSKKIIGRHHGLILVIVIFSISIIKILRHILPIMHAPH
jgi:hypothetical protein